MTLIKHPAYALVALLLTTISLVGLAPAAHADDDGALTWGFKSSWRFYVVNIAAGTISTANGATVVGGEYVFPQVSTTQTTPGGTGTTKYEGSVTWKSTNHGFDITMKDPWLEVESSTEATLTADLTDSAGVSRGRIGIATVTLSDPAVATDTLTWTDRPTVITEDAAESFDNYANAPGDALDAVVYKAGIGAPAPTCNGKPATVQLALGQEPSAGDDVIVGTAAGETINGLGGNDTICGLGGNDSLFGGEGNDALLGGDGNDFLYGDAGNDLINGGAGDDGISGGVGADNVYGGAGTDLVSYASATAGVTVKIDNVANDGNATDGKADNIRSDVERINGSSFADTMLGHSGVNQFYGFGGADLLNGYGGNDYLNGGAHADRLYGGAGNDGLYAKEGYRDAVIDGGAGSDWAARDAGDPRALNVP